MVYSYSVSNRPLNAHVFQRVGMLALLLLVASTSITSALAKSAKVVDTVRTVSAKAPVIAEIDDFTSPHGEKIFTILSANNAVVKKYDISQEGDRNANIDKALAEILTSVQSGTHFDAVNLSQQEFTDSPLEKTIRAKLMQLMTLNVPVSIAAGNGGITKPNQMAAKGSFIVVAATDGQVNKDSGPGNVVVNAETTSLAAALFTTRVADLHAKGWNLTKIRKWVTHQNL